MSLFKVIVESSVTTQKRLTINISATMQAYERRNMEFLDWILVDMGLASSLMQRGICKTLDAFHRY